MRAEPWMNRDERTPEQIYRDKMAYLKDREARLMNELKVVRKDIADLWSAQPKSLRRGFWRALR